jgi:hypothetical protein
MSQSKFDTFWARVLQEPKRAKDHALREGMEQCTYVIDLLQSAPLTAANLNLVHAVGPLMRTLYILRYTDTHSWNSFYRQKLHDFQLDIVELLQSNFDLQRVQRVVRSLEESIQNMKVFCDRDIREFRLSKQPASRASQSAHIATAGSIIVGSVFIQTLTRSVCENPEETTFYKTFGHIYSGVVSLLTPLALGAVAYNYYLTSMNELNILHQVRDLLAEINDILGQCPIAVVEDEEKDGQSVPLTA